MNFVRRNVIRHSSRVEQLMMMQFVFYNQFRLLFLELWTDSAEKDFISISELLQFAQLNFEWVCCR